MKTNLRYLAGAAVGAVVAMGFTSCAYDPNYSSVGVGGSYSTGYGNGYGYGGSGFSSSVFIGTGDPDWGYDPTCYSYYHYGSRRYYDPYSYGYYPIGYRPPIVYGVPHPYGWRPGGGYIRPPVRVSNRILSDYQDRESRYRNSSYGWAKQVRQQPSGTRREVDRKDQRYSDQRSSPAPTSRSREEYRSSGSSRESQTRYQENRSSSRSGVRSQNRGGIPSRYNTPTNSSEQQARPGQRTAQANKNARAQSKDEARQANRSEKKQKQSDKDKERDRQYR